MTNNKGIRGVLGALALLALSLAAVPSSADAHGALAPTLAASTRQAAVSGIAVVKTELLYRSKDRPVVHTPTGAAFWVRAPHGTTAVDLYNEVLSCQAVAGHQPFCVQGASVRVRADGGLYVITVTSDQWAVARQIQQGARSTNAHRG